MAIDLAALGAFIDEHNRWATFDGLAADLERICHRDQPKRGTVPDAYSRSWFAQKIRLTIAAVRQLQQSGRTDEAMAVAVRLGLEAAGFRFLERTEYLTKQAARARKGAKIKRDNAARAQERLRADVDAVRRRHPDDSIRRTAERLLKQYQPARLPAQTHGIDALAKRIARLKK